MANVIVCCKLPNGFILAVGGKQVKINGSNTTVIKGVNGVAPIGAYGKTVVDEALWNEWLKDHSNFSPVAKNAVWAEKDEKSATSKGRELENESTGLEGIKQDGTDKRTPGGKVKKADSQ